MSNSTLPSSIIKSLHPDVLEKINKLKLDWVADMVTITITDSETTSAMIGGVRPGWLTSSQIALFFFLQLIINVYYLSEY